MNINSAIYQGRVNHWRSEPIQHKFGYKLFMMYLDLAELPSLLEDTPGWAVNRKAIAAFHRSDYLGSNDVPLDLAVRNRIADELGWSPAGPIRVLTQLRYFGKCFNPVSFYYCFDHSGIELEAIVAEITNTPWGERHSYVLPCNKNGMSAGTKRFSFAKEFHVSPFMDMDQHYQWSFTNPSDRLCVEMNNSQGGKSHFGARLELKRQEISSRRLTGLLFQYPLMSWRVLTAIYWQALMLKLKKCPFYDHPKTSEESNVA